MPVKLCLELLWGMNFIYLFIFLNFVLHRTEMKFTLKNIGTLGFCFQMQQRGDVSLESVDKQCFPCFLLLVDVF